VFLSKTQKVKKLIKSVLKNVKSVVLGQKRWNYIYFCCEYQHCFCAKFGKIACFLPKKALLGEIFLQKRGFYPLKWNV